MTHQEFLASDANRQRYWARSFAGWERFAERTRPNAAHHAVARLQSAGRVWRLLTQNVDRLHQARGAPPRFRSRPALSFRLFPSGLSIPALSLGHSPVGPLPQASLLPCAGIKSPARPLSRRPCAWPLLRFCGGPPLALLQEEFPFDFRLPALLWLRTWAEFGSAGAGSGQGDAAAVKPEAVP